MLLSDSHTPNCVKWKLCFSGEDLFGSKLLSANKGPFILISVRG